ncbi:hypothetical protein RD792_003812 [Penstemon davidsonii]|uniref:Alpha N-terminal protein methyltransferase 1 n=1 Tax=Penstemon davidsonii TaxID=160366 RepID=A0ABR0DFQ4_9LAMI|nr:hypothetical protein RD792_003812 [Penstemon davidsonii]
MHKTPAHIVPRSPPPLALYQFRNSKLLRLTPRVIMDGFGTDSEGRQFKNAEEMWREQVGDADPLKKSQWYSDGVGYWQGSEAFFNTILAEKFPDISTGRRLVALDCGSGIGRVSKNLLIRYFNEVDLLEPVSHFLDAARINLAPENLMVTEDYKAVNFFCVPLQEFTPEPKRYDVIWVQWCIGHLSDDDFVSFFKRAKVKRSYLKKL